MKKLTLLIFTLFFATLLHAQTNIGPVQKKMLDSLCNCMNRLDFSKITTPAQANKAFTDCFTAHTELLGEVADELHLNLADDAAGDSIGSIIGKNLLNEKCSSFLKLAGILAKQSMAEPEVVQQSTAGTFKRVDLKGFNYIIITDKAGSERSFLWLREFPGSEKFTAAPASLAGKKVKITFQELEVYLPQAKGYYKVKEITAVEFL